MVTSVAGRQAEAVLTFAIRLGASLDQADGVLGELASGLNECENLIHFV